MSDAVVRHTLDATQLAPDVARSITELRLEAWPHLAERQDGTPEFLIERWRDYTGPPQHRPLYHLAYHAGRLVALAHTLPRTIASGNGELRIMGLASVCVLKSERGHGFGRIVVDDAFTRVQRDGFDFSLFQTTPQIEPFYRRLGAARVENRFFNSFADDPQANPFWDPVAMRYPAKGDWPEGDIDLRGPGY